jgi:hypothetical protein
MLATTFLGSVLSVTGLVVGGAVVWTRRSTTSSGLVAEPF